MKFKFLSHTADAKFQSFGKTIEAAFSNAAYAMVSLIVDKKVKSAINKKIKIKGRDKEALLYNFLEELLFLFDGQQFILAEITKIKIKQDEDNQYDLEAELIGDNAEKYQKIGNVKAITYNSMFVKKEKGKFVCQVVLDM